MDWHSDRTISATELQGVMMLRNRSKIFQSRLLSLLEAISLEHGER